MPGRRATHLTDAVQPSSAARLVEVEFGNRVGVSGIEVGRLVEVVGGQVVQLSARIGIEFECGLRGCAGGGEWRREEGRRWKGRTTATHYGTWDTLDVPHDRRSRRWARVWSDAKIAAWIRHAEGVGLITLDGGGRITCLRPDDLAGDSHSDARDADPAGGEVPAGGAGTDRSSEAVELLAAQVARLLLDRIPALRTLHDLGSATAARFRLPIWSAFVHKLY